MITQLELDGTLTLLTKVGELNGEDFLDFVLIIIEASVELGKLLFVLFLGLDNASLMGDSDLSDNVVNVVVELSLFECLQELVLLGELIKVGDHLDLLASIFISLRVSLILTEDFDGGSASNLVLLGGFTVFHDVDCTEFDSFVGELDVGDSSFILWVE